MFGNCFFPFTKYHLLLASLLLLFPLTAPDLIAQRWEPQALLRALGCSAPVTAFDVDFNREVTNGHARFFGSAEDVSLAIEKVLHAEFRDPGLAPAPLLEHLVAAGCLGRKTGRGFREYARR